MELSGRLTRSVRFPGMSMTDSETVASYYMEFLCHRTKEMVVAAFFDQKYRFIADEVHSVGSDCASIVSVREIFRSALRANAAHVILLHNHPVEIRLPAEKISILPAGWPRRARL